MNWKKKIFYTLLWSTSLMSARHHVVKGEKTFQKLINQYPYAVVCFAESKPDKGGEVTREDAKQMREEFKEEFKDINISLKGASDKHLYDKYLDKEVGFILVDAASGKAEEIDDKLSLTKMPTCLLFKRGRPYTTLHQYAQIFAPISQDGILSLLEKNVEDELGEIVDKKKDQERLEREERIERYKAYARTPYAWGPGWGPGWGYGYGPYWGVGWGWRGGYGRCW